MKNIFHLSHSKEVINDIHVRNLSKLRFYGTLDERQSRLDVMAEAEMSAENPLQHATKKKLEWKSKEQVLSYFVKREVSLSFVASRWKPREIELKASTQREARLGESQTRRISVSDSYASDHYSYVDLSITG